MASYTSLKTLTCIVLALVLCVQNAHCGITCEHLSSDKCAFAVSSSGTRCVLEKAVKRGEEEVYTCRTSEIEAEKLTDWIESEQCIEACGVHRNSLGISSDALLETDFARKLCSPECYQGCPNIVDLYFNLAASEGVFLPKLCEAQGGSARREMVEIRSSGNVAAGPESGLPEEAVTFAPAGLPARLVVLPPAGLPPSLVVLPPAQPPF